MFLILIFTIGPESLSDLGYQKYYPDESLCVAETGAELTLNPCQRIPLEFPGLAGRAEARGMGKTRNRDIYAFVVGTVGGGGAIVEPAGRLFRSTDGGRSWTGRTLTLPAGVGTGFIVLPDDSMLLAANSTGPDGRGAVLIYQSRDEGERWEQIGKTADHPYETVVAGSLSLMKDGTLLMPASRQTNRLEDYNRLCVVYRSGDGGKTWMEGDRTCDGVGAAHVLELRPGRLLGAFRFSGAYRDWHQLKAQAWGAADQPDGDGRIFKHVLLGNSEDGGITWDTLHPVADKAGKPLLIFGETHGQLVQLNDQKVVLVSDHRYPYELAETVAWLSWDGGDTWTGTKYHLSAGTGYASSVALEDATIVTVTGNTRLGPEAGPIEPWSVAAIRWKP